MPKNTPIRISVRLPERFGFCLAPSAHNLMCSPESPQYPVARALLNTSWGNSVIVYSIHRKSKMSTKFPYFSLPNIDEIMVADPVIFV